MITEQEIIEILEGGGENYGFTDTWETVGHSFGHIVFYKEKGLSELTKAILDKIKDKENANN